VRLLVVEDDSAILDFLKRGLTESGYEIDTARDAKSAQTLATDAVYEVSSLIWACPIWTGWI